MQVNTVGELCWPQYYARGCLCFLHFVSTLWAADVLDSCCYLCLKFESLLTGGPFGDPAICSTNIIDVLYVSGVLDERGGGVTRGELTFRF